MKLNFNTHIGQKIKSLIRPHLEYGDILYDKPDHENFQNKIEKVQYKAYLAIIGAIQGTSREKLYEELGLHSLVERHRRNKLIFFYKIVNGLLSDYLYSYLNFSSQQNYPLRSAKASKIMPISTKTKPISGTLNQSAFLKN